MFHQLPETCFGPFPANVDPFDDPTMKRDKLPPTPAWVIGLSFTGKQVTPYRLLSSAAKHEMFCHFARQAYEHYYAQLRLEFRASGLHAALGYYLLEKARILREGKLYHIWNALENAWSTLITNCRDTDGKLVVYIYRSINEHYSPRLIDMSSPEFRAVFGNSPR